MKFQTRNNYVVNWPEYPLLRVTICFMAGIYLSDVSNIDLFTNVTISVSLLIAFVFLNVAFRQSKVNIRMLSLLLLLVGVTFGMFRGNLQKGSNNSFHYQKHICNENWIVGKMASELKKKKSISATIEVRQINNEKSSGKLLVYFNKKDSLVNYKIGDIIKIDGKVHKLKDNPNPQAFNFKDYLKYKGIDYQMFLKKGSHELIITGELSIVNNLAFEIRNWALSIFEKRLKDKDQLATASAMVLGYREHLNDELYTTFSETGAVHVLAVSGLHVGIICMIFIFLFNRIKIDGNVFKSFKLITLLSVVWIYALVTGASPAVLRAAVMFSFILLGRLWFKGANIYNILAFSALILLLYDPFLLFQLSFQFSYLALISIVFFQPHLERLYETKHWVTTRIWQLITVSIAAQILIFPISVYHFHQFPSYFILSGVAAVFLATFILGLGLLVLSLDQMPIIGDTVSTLYSYLLEGFLQIISGIQSLPFNKVDGIYISLSSVFVLYLLVGTVMFLISLKPQSYKDVFHKKSRRRKLAKIIVAGCITFLAVNSILFTYRISNQKELIVYDVSKSTAIDIFIGNKLYQISSDHIDESKLNYACQAYRVYNGNPDLISLTQNSNLQHDLLFWSKNGSMIFKGRHLFFANKENTQSSIPCESDIVLIVNNSILLPYQFLERHSTSLVVLDNSISYKVKNQWIHECRKRDIKIHDIRKNGVFRL